MHALSCECELAGCQAAVLQRRSMYEWACVLCISMRCSEEENEELNSTEEEELC
jgi:hypothetical protein